MASVDFSYVPSDRDRRLESGGARLAALRYWWLPGALLTLTGALLAGLGSSGWSVLATVTGATLLTGPYLAGERDLRAARARRPRPERHVTVSADGVRIAGDGVTSQLSWTRLEKRTDTGTHWRLDWDTGSRLYLPKSAVPDAGTAELARILETVSPCS